MKKLIWLVPFLLIGCAKVHLDCSSGLPQTFAVTGSQVGSQIVALGVAAAGTAMMGARSSDATTPTPTGGSTLDYSWLAIFGPDNGGLGCGATQPPTTTINNNQGGTLNMTAPK